MASTMDDRARSEVAWRTRAAARSHIYCEGGVPEGATAIYTLADPRDARCPRYVGQTRDLRRRFMQHVHTARLWLPDEVPWWVRSPKHRPLYEWIRALHRDGGRLPFMSVAQCVEPGSDPLVAERATILRFLADGARLLNVEARTRGPQLPLL
jgi:hypothetical protein